MTWGGGKPHAVGDRGQRYEVSFLNGVDGRMVMGWTDTAESAQSMCEAVLLHPDWSDPQVRDRSTEKDGK